MNDNTDVVELELFDRDDLAIAEHEKYQMSDEVYKELQDSGVKLLDFEVGYHCKLLIMFEVESLNDFLNPAIIAIIKKFMHVSLGSRGLRIRCSALNTDVYNLDELDRAIDSANKIVSES
ncbi:hypothetical protein [Dongshaea marina]|uniref:hypothetical protein n=1 Tax=Dongshaea marina TaxID=2047966 RepID=UPI000D3ED773|nr:hypothetical protein [Dongshaea marina]